MIQYTHAKGHQYQIKGWNKSQVSKMDKDKLKYYMEGVQKLFEEGNTNKGLEKIAFMLVDEYNRRF